MNTEIEKVTVSYKQICDKNGFCVVKIIPQNDEVKVPIENNIPQKNVEQSTKKPVKLSSSRKNKKF